MITFSSLTRSIGVISLAVLTATLTGAINAQAQIINPTLFSSDNLNTDYGNFNETNLTTQTGLSSPVNTGDSLASVAAVTHDGDFGGLWGTNDNYSISDPRPTFIWDLGSQSSISNIILWQFYGGNATGNPNQLNNFSLRFSTTPTFVGDAAFTGTLTPDINTAQIFNVTGTGRYVEMTAVDNSGGGDRIGFGQVRFGAAAVVPEASTFTLAFPALALVGTVLIRRRKTA